MSLKKVNKIQPDNFEFNSNNLDLAKKHANSLKSLETDLNYLSEEAKSSLEKFKELVDKSLDQLEENTPENLTSEQKVAKAKLKAQKQWLDNHQDIIIQRAT